MSQDILVAITQPIDTTVFTNFESEYNMLKYIISLKIDIYGFYLYRLEKWGKVYRSGMFAEWESFPGFSFQNFLDEHKIKITCSPINIDFIDEAIFSELYLFLPRIQQTMILTSKALDDGLNISKNNDMYKHLIAEESFNTIRVIQMIDYTIYQNFIAQR